MQTLVEIGPSNASQGQHIRNDAIYIYICIYDNILRHGFAKNEDINDILKIRINTMP